MSTPHGAGELVDARGRKYLTAEERARFLATVRTHRQPAVQTLARTLARTVKWARSWPPPASPAPRPARAGFATATVSPR